MQIPPENLKNESKTHHFLKFEKIKKLNKEVQKTKWKGLRLRINQLNSVRLWTKESWGNKSDFKIGKYQSASKIMKTPWNSWGQFVNQSFKKIIGLTAIL